MKKENIILLLTLPIGIIISFLLLSLSNLFLKNLKYLITEPLTAKQFETIMTDNNFIIDNVNNNENEESIISIQKAYKENKYEIFFAIYDNSTTADKIYIYNTDNMNNYLNGIYTYKSMNSINYSKYTATSTKEYAVLIKHKNTVISILASKEYKDEINKILKKLKY